MTNHSRIDLLLLNTPQPYQTDLPLVPYASLPPLGLAYIATWLNNEGFSVELLDAEHLGLDAAATAAIVNEKQPRFLGINLLSPTYQVATQILKMVDPGITIVAGGSHADALPHHVMNDPRMRKISFLILGDGEFKMEALLKGTPDPETIPGIVFRRNNKIILNPDEPANKRWNPVDLDALPFINRNFLASDPFFSEGELEASIVASRGCVFNCSFCSAAYNMTQRRPRVRSIQNILEEINFLTKTHDVTAVRFVDDLLLRSKSAISMFAKSLTESKLNTRIVWAANAHAGLLWHAPDEVFADLARSGCRQLSIGIESGTQRVLNYANKRITPEQVKTVVTRLSQYGIRASGYFIVGFPDETRDEIESTIAFFHELRTVSLRYAKNKAAIFRGNIFEFKPLPRTQEWKRLLDKGFTVAELLDNYDFTFLDGLDERMRRRWTGKRSFCETHPKDIQKIIVQALTKQTEELEKCGGLPDFAWNAKPS